MNTRITQLAIIGTAALAVAGAIAAATINAAEPSSSPSYTKDGELILPADYRAWTFLTSNVAMGYPMKGMDMDNMPQTFGNVFVNPSAVPGYEKTGVWPDKTVLLIENRASATRPTLTKNAKFQTTILGFEAHVKDSSRGGWTFYFMRSNEKSGKPIPKSEACYTCHEKNAAVDTTFVQYYPTLVDAAKKMGTYKQTAE